MSWQRYAGFGLLGAGAGAGLGAVLRQPAQEQQELLTPEQQNQQLALDLLTPTAAGAAAGLGGAWLARQLMERPVEPDRMAAAPEVLRAVDQVVPASALVADAPMTADAEQTLRGVMRSLGGMLESGRGYRSWKGFADERERMQRVGGLLADALKQTDAETVQRLKSVVDAVDVSGPVSEEARKVFNRNMMNALYDHDSYRAALEHSLREPTWLSDRSVYHGWNGSAMNWAQHAYEQEHDRRNGRTPKPDIAPDDAELLLNYRDFDSTFKPNPAMETEDLVMYVPGLPDVTPEERRAALLAEALVRKANGPLVADARNTFLANAMDVDSGRMPAEDYLRVRKRALDLTRDELIKQSAELGFDLSDWDFPAWVQQATPESIESIHSRLIRERDANPGAFDQRDITYGEMFGRRRGA
jgi:hypothetical protein